MSENSKIEWTDHTFNPWIGCTKVSPGCAHCYAESEDKRRGWTADGWGKGKPRKRTSAAYWKLPVRWDRAAVRYPDACANGHRMLADVQAEIGNTTCPAHVLNGKLVGDRAGVRCGAPILRDVRPRVFCASLADWLDDEVPIEWLADLLALIHATPNLDWLLLTKRPENFQPRLLLAWKHLYECGHIDAALWVDRWLNLTPGAAVAVPHNVWIGTSVEDQSRADERIPQLLQIPARIRFLSCEPLLGPIDLRDVSWDNQAARDALGVDWVIVGGESGHGARPCYVQWIRSLVSQCKAAAVPAFVKQFGAHPIVDNPSDWVITGHGRRDRKGGDMAEWPEDLRVREFPKLEVTA